jgi:hypothetical protein
MSRFLVAIGSAQAWGVHLGGAEQREAYEKIKEYIVSPPMLRAPKVGNLFKVYIAVQEDGKEFLVAYVSRRLLDAETQYARRSRGKLLMENSDRLQVEGKPILDNTNQLPGETGLESGKTEPISEKIEPESGGKIGLWEKAKPTLVKKFQEESVTKQDEVEKDQAPLDEGKTKPISEDGSVTGGDMIRTDWRSPLLKCHRNPGKTMDKKGKRQVLKYTSLDGDLYQELLTAYY